jgi:hypothetical protein
MKKLLTLLLLCYSSFVALAQQPVEIGKVLNDIYVITADTSALRKALQQTLADGTNITSMHIESVNQWHYLIGTGKHFNYTKMIAVELTYTINSRTFWLTPGMGHKTCASAGCGGCVPFKENGNIIGCHCLEQGTVSNECNFKTVPQSPFYSKLKRHVH